MKMKPSASRRRLGQGPPQEVLTMLVSGWGRDSAWTMLGVEQKLWSPKDKLTATPQPRDLRCSQRRVHNYAAGLNGRVDERSSGRPHWLGRRTRLTHQRCGECQASRRPGRALLSRGPRLTPLTRAQQGTARGGGRLPGSRVGVHRGQQKLPSSDGSFYTLLWWCLLQGSACLAKLINLHLKSVFYANVPQ